MQFQLSTLREEIIARSRAGEALAKIECELIEPNVADEDERAALWLLAWCQSDSAGRSATQTRQNNHDRRAAPRRP